jgi:hypothetical protein
MLKAVPSVKVANSTMRAFCKRLVEAGGDGLQRLGVALVQAGGGGGVGRYGGRAVADADPGPWSLGECVHGGQVHLG